MTLLPLIATAATAACAGGGSTLGYGLPSPPDAAYRITDSVEVRIDAPGGLWEVSGGYSLTLDMLFEMDLTGMRVRGIAESFEGSLSDPVGDLGDLDGTLEFVTNRGGVAEVRSFPRIFGLPAREFSLAGLPYDLFPRLPDDSVGQGGTWKDRVRWHTDQPDAEHDYDAAYTYTLVGDTVVDGREFVHIAVAGRLDIWNGWGGWGNFSLRELRGPLTGLILWDPDRGLVAHHEYETDLAGTVTKDEQSFEATVARRVRIRLRG